jgi:nucleotide-binding universal stress UspA family protein
LVVGRSPHHRVEAPRGGTPAALASRAECPVVVVPSTWTAGPAPGRIVVAMKSRTHARELLSHAFDIAEDRGGRIVVVTAWELFDPTMDRQEARDHAAEWEAEGTRVLEGLVEEWRRSYPKVPVDLRVTHGRAATVLEHASADADLLLLARHQHFVPPYGRLGSTAHRVLRTSRCPVEVVPANVVADVRAVSSSGLRTI